MSNYDYFELKYLEEINEIYCSMKNESDLFNLRLFSKNNNCIDLLNFVYSNLELVENESDIDDNNEFTSNDEEY